MNKLTMEDYIAVMIRDKGCCVVCRVTSTCKNDVFPRPKTDTHPDAKPTVENHEAICASCYRKT